MEKVFSLPWWRRTLTQLFRPINASSDPNPLHQSSFLNSVTVVVVPCFPQVHQMNARCFLCFRCTHHINGVSHDNTGCIHMLLACLDICAAVYLCWVTGVRFQLWFPFIDQTLTGVLTLSDTLSVIDGWIKHKATEWTEMLFWLLLCGQLASLLAGAGSCCVLTVSWTLSLISNKAYAWCVIREDEAF